MTPRASRRTTTSACACRLFKTHATVSCFLAFLGEEVVLFRHFRVEVLELKNISCDELVVRHDITTRFISPQAPPPRHAMRRGVLLEFVETRLRLHYSISVRREGHGDVARGGVATLEVLERWRRRSSGAQNGSATASASSNRERHFHAASALASENRSKPKIAWSSPSVRCTEVSSSVDVA